MLIWLMRHLFVFCADAFSRLPPPYPAQPNHTTLLQGLASIAFTPTSSVTASGTPGSRGSNGSLGRRMPLTPSTAGGGFGSPATASQARGSHSLQGGQEEEDGAFWSSASRAAALIAGSGSSPLAPAGASPAAVSQINRWWESTAAGAGPPAVTEGQDSAPAAAAGTATAADCTPAATRRAVRFADTVQAGSNARGPMRVGTPYSAAAAAAAEAEDASPVVGSCRRSPLGATSAGVSPAAGAAAQRSPLAAMQSAARPVRRFALETGDSDGGSSSDEDDGGEVSPVCNPAMRRPVTARVA